MALKGLDEVMTKIRSERGLSVRIAEACGVARAAVYQWKRVPVGHVDTVAAVLKMSRKRIRPDIFGPKQGRT
jgi:hypothetical protein